MVGFTSYGYQFSLCPAPLAEIPKVPKVGPLNLFIQLFILLTFFPTNQMLLHFMSLLYQTSRTANGLAEMFLTLVTFVGYIYLYPLSSCNAVVMLSFITLPWCDFSL